MGLFKPIGLEISGYNITLDANIDVFVGDSLKLVFQIKSWDICRSNSANSNVVLTGLIPYLLVENQFGKIQLRLPQYSEILLYLTFQKNILISQVRVDYK